MPLLLFRQGERIRQLVLALRPDSPRGLGRKADLVTRDHPWLRKLYRILRFISTAGIRR